MGGVNLSVAICLLLLAPLGWGACVDGVRRMARRRKSDRPFVEGNEKFALLLMTTPAILGAFFVLAFSLAPAEMAKLPAFGAVELPLGEVFVVAEGARIEQAATLRLQHLIALMIAGLYGVGVVVMTMRHLALQAKLRAIVRRAKKLERGGCRTMVITSTLISPFASACGKIVLPESLDKTLSKEQIELVIAHESAHFLRGDPGYFSCLAWIDIVFWINPFVRIQTKRCRLAAELACDAMVLREAPLARKAYGDALLAVLKLSALRNTAGNALHGVPAVLSTRNQGDYRMRITEIMKPSPVRRKRSKWAMASLFLAFSAPIATLQYALAETVAAGSNEFSVRPLEGRMTSSYGERHDPISGETRFHKGTDIAARHGTIIVAPAAGLVVALDRVEDLVAADDLKQAYGNLLTLDHGDGYVIRYAQLSGFEVKKGDQVDAGQTIARVGVSGRSTGPHLHVEVFKDGERVDPESVLDLPRRKNKR